MPEHNYEVKGGKIHMQRGNIMEQLAEIMLQEKLISPSEKISLMKYIKEGEAG